MIVTDRQDELRLWLSERTNGYFDPATSRFIGLETNGNIVAVTGYTDYNQVSVHMHIGIDGKLTREYTHFCYWYAFEQLGVYKVVGLVAADNDPALNFDKHSGFVEEARIKDVLPSGDLIILSMTKEQCKFLKWNNGKIYKQK